MIEVAPPKQPKSPFRLRAAVLDWAGTTVDFGSRAPVAAVLNAFEQAGVPVSETEARRPMGKAKREHLRSLLDDPDIQQRWLAKYGQPASEAELDALYERFLSVQAMSVAESSAVIAGCPEAVQACRDQGLKIGSSTGYTRALLEPVAERAAREGYQPDVMLSADDVSPGRPAPWLCMEAARRLGVYPMLAVVKVDDTPAGVEAGRNAGSWVVGVVASGNEVGLSSEAFQKLDDTTRLAKLAAARERLIEAGAHYLIDTIAELPAVVARINDRLTQHERP